MDASTLCARTIQAIELALKAHDVANAALTHDQKINIEFNIELLFALRSQDEDDTSALVKIACDAALSFADLHNARDNSEHIEPKFVHLFVQAMIVKVLRPEVFAGAVPRLAPASDLGPASDVQVGPARTPSPRKSPRKSPQKSPGKARWGRHQILQLCYFKQYLGLSYPNIGDRIGRTAQAVYCKWHVIVRDDLEADYRRECEAKAESGEELAEPEGLLPLPVAEN